MFLSTSDELELNSHLSSCVATDIMNLTGSIVFPVEPVNKASLHLKLFTLRHLRNKMYPRITFNPNPDQKLDMEFSLFGDAGPLDKDHAHGDLFVPAMTQENGFSENNGREDDAENGFDEDDAESGFDEEDEDPLAKATHM